MLSFPDPSLAFPKGTTVTLNVIRTGAASTSASVGVRLSSSTLFNPTIPYDNTRTISWSSGDVATRGTTFTLPSVTTPTYWLGADLINPNGDIVGIRQHLEVVLFSEGIEPNLVALQTTLSRSPSPAEYLSKKLQFQWGSPFESLTTALSTISAFQVVALSSDERAVVADKGDSATIQGVWGIAMNGASANQVVRVMGTGGEVINEAWNFTPGRICYLHTGGSLTQDVSLTQTGHRLPVGVARNPKTLAVRIGYPDYSVPGG